MSMIVETQNLIGFLKHGVHWDHLLVIFTFPKIPYLLLNNAGMEHQLVEYLPYKINPY